MTNTVTEGGRMTHDTNQPRMSPMAELVMLTGHEFYIDGDKAEAARWYAKAADMMRAENKKRAQRELGVNAI